MNINFKKYFNLKNFPTIGQTIHKYLYNLKQNSDLVSYNIISPEVNNKLQNLLKKKLETISFENLKENKAIACFIASSIGDSLGCHLESYPYAKNSKLINDFNDVEKYYKLIFPAGQWTDDTSLSLCIADSILINNYTFDALDLRHRMFLWWFAGYNNGRKNSTNKLSYGIGGATIASFYDFIKNVRGQVKKPLDYVLKLRKKDFSPLEIDDIDIWKQNIGNGGVMRMAPVGIAFYNNLEEGMEYAREQSFVTHNSEESAELCRFLAFLIHKFINCDSKEHKEKIRILNNLSKDFRSVNKSIEYLVKSEKELEYNGFHEENNFSKTLEDRNWNWKSENFDYSDFRKLKPNYVGIYSMDAVAMSLYIIYYSDGIMQAIRKAISMRGDSDSVGTIVGMLVGAFYGCDKELIEMYNFVNKWDEYDIAIKGYLLFHGMNRLEI